MLGRSSALSNIAARAARGMGAGMGGGGHANNPAFMFQKQWSQEKWRALVYLIPMIGGGIYVPWKCVCFAQKKAGVPGW